MTNVADTAIVYPGTVLGEGSKDLDYADVVRRGKVIVDFRNATSGVEADGKVWKL